MKFNLIVAACENMGIGRNGDLPWRLRNEMKYFTAKTKQVRDETKKNAVIMGRKTYFSIPDKLRPLSGRLNVILSRDPNAHQYPMDVLTCKTFNEAIALLSQEEYTREIENIWIVGGNSVYKEAIDSTSCHRIYFTEVKATFDCDTYFPEIDKIKFKLVENDDDMPSDIQEENGIKYQYKIFEKCDY